MKIHLRLFSALFLIGFLIVGCEKETPPKVPSPQNPLLQDALSEIKKNGEGEVSLENLPQSILELKPIRAFVVFDVLVVYTGPQKGKVLNPQEDNSCPGINMFMISPEGTPGIFDFFVMGGSN